MTQTLQTNEMMVKTIAKEIGITTKQVHSVINLLDEGNTVPFIARYRKELTGSLDEVQIKDVQEKWTYLQNLETRKEEVIRLISEQGKLTDELQAEIMKSTKLQQVEDLYRPYKQKRRTKATVAKEKGLEPLAEWLYTFPMNVDVLQYATGFISEEKEVLSAEDAIQGAKDIIAEWISDDATFRQWIRNETFKQGTIETVVKDQEKDEKNVYEMYYE